MEYEYWHEREVGLGVLVEQLKHSTISLVLNILNNTASVKAAVFHHLKSDVIRSYIEARDNDKFLSTVLRYFRVCHNLL